MTILRRQVLKALVAPALLIPSLLRPNAMAQPAPTAKRTVASRIGSVAVFEKELTHWVDGTAIVQEMPKIVAQSTGTIASQYIEIGQTVKRGEVLFEIDSPEVMFGFNTASAELARVKAIAAQKQNHANRQQALRKSDLVSQSSAEAALFDAKAAQQSVDAAQAQLQVWQTSIDKLTVRAPFDGIVVERVVSIGSFVSAGTVVAALLQPERTLFEISVPERLMNAVVIGAPVSVLLSTGEQFASEIVRVSPVIETASRTVLVHITANADKSFLVRPGASAQVALNEHLAREVYAVPESAVLNEKNRSFVYRVDASLTAKRTLVEIRGRTAGLVLISKGIDDKERIALDAAFLYDGAVIQEVTR